MKNLTRLLSVVLLALMLAAPATPSAAAEAPPGYTSPVDAATLRPGDGVRSPDGRFRLIHQHDGNVVLYGPSGAVWSTGTAGAHTARLVFQYDGNLVLYRTDGQPLWHTATHARGDKLAVQNDANLVVYDDEQAIWAIRGMTPPLDQRGSSGDGCGGWRHTVAHHFGAETTRGCRVLLCESNGNRYADNPRSTASGLWQFLDGTWRSTTGTPGPAKSYSPSVQTAAAKRLRDSSGWSPWSCR